MREQKKCASAIAAVYLLVNLLSAGAQLDEGSPCTMEDGSAGKCVRMPNCPVRIQQLRKGTYNPSTGRCSFNNFDEIVCCPSNQPNKVVQPGNDGILSEGSPCKMEDGCAGDCTALPKCPMRVKEVLEGKRFTTLTGRCSFNGFTEIVCCPRDSRPTTYPGSNGVRDRPAKRVCLEYENQITGEDGRTINPNIFNGEAAELGEFPYMVALGYLLDRASSNLSYICGGTLISSQHILTAAHCLSNINEYTPKVVRLGSVNLREQSRSVQVIPILRAIIHPSYRRSLNYYDIGIVVLKRAVKYSKYVVPICLQTIPIPNLDVLLKMSLVVTGWGATSFENMGTTELQKTPSLQVVKRGMCDRHYRNFERLPRGVDDSLICVVDRNKTRLSDGCQGDSGGPLLLLSRYTSTVIGIVSFGQSCGSSIPAIYTSVYYYLDWIEQVVWPKRRRAA